MPGISWPFILPLRRYASYVAETCGHVAALLVQPLLLNLLLSCSGMFVRFSPSIDSLLSFDGSTDTLGI